MCITYLFFYRALKAQGYDRKNLPYVGWAQPYVAWFGLVTMIFTVGAYGYTTFLPGCKSARCEEPCLSFLH
jgi:amino acid transporter